MLDIKKIFFTQIISSGTGATFAASSFGQNVIFGGTTELIGCALRGILYMKPITNGTILGANAEAYGDWRECIFKPKDPSRFASDYGVAPVSTATGFNVLFH